MDTATKKGIDVAKSASKKVFEKTVEPAKDLTESEIADKFTSVGQTKGEEKEDEKQEIYIPSAKKTANY